jgi:hypothetical protein
MNVSVGGYILPTIIPKGSKSVEDEKKCFLNHFNLCK